MMKAVADDNISSEVHEGGTIVRPSPKSKVKF